IRLKKLTREYQMRNRISADLHDEVSATLSSISFFAQAIASGRKPEQNEKFLSLILESSGDAKEKISDIVWAINPENDEWNSFFSRCRRFASDVFESRNIAFTLRIDESYPGKIDMQLRQHLWMIFKEMITNVARHSGASRAEVILHIKNGELQLVVQDDGRGLSNPDASSGNGLRNIRQRADKIRATAVLETEPGRGTRWIVRVML
ncbi:MAG: histidine kinase, partial [Candidatus Cyclonatronum sp.]|uniref:sensor histidine kinase n=1 Tax=Cyclonatronum sp. TaxID=3024185 RepID=UPI0025C44FD2